MAFYLKYRPRKVADIDLTEARETLTRILGSKPFPQAILLAGPRGIGKTSAARIIAKSLNCQDKKPGQIDPCNRCSSCLAIDKGAFLDVLEIDAASNRGIDDIRQLKEGVNLAPVRGKYKVYIIDEVHMLTNEAFNALLKTLEEPPQNVVFLLCTTNPEKIPQTVLSRCVRVNFHKASEKEVLRALKRVVKKENLPIENDQVLLTIAQNVDGSFRDGQKVLEELSFGHKGEITVDEAIKAVGRQAALEPSRLLRAISGGDLAAALEEVGRLENNGVDWPFYLKALLEEIRGFLHYSWGLPDGKEGDFPSDEPLIFWAETFSGIVGKVKTSALPVLVVELAVRKIISASRERKRDSGERKLSPESNSGAATLKEQEKKEVSGQKEAGNKKKASDSQPLLTISQQQWGELLERIKPRNHSLEAFLKAARPVSFEDNRLILEVYYRFHKECLEKEVNRRVIEAVAAEILNCKVNLFFRLGEKPPKSAGQGPDEGQGEDSYRLAEKIFGGEEQK